LELADQYLTRYIDLNPWHGSFHGRLAGTLMYLGDRQGAIDSAERALKLNPALWSLHGFLANAYSQQGDHASELKHRTLLARKHPPEARPTSRP
jgi:tetratricopeptide (TPR) repeat protein